MSVRLLTVTVLLLGGSTGAGEYRILPNESLLVARTFRGGPAASLGHDHTIRAAAVSGQIRYVPGHPDEDAVEVTVPSASLVVDDAPGRDFFRLGPGPSEGDKRKITQDMASAKQLDVERFPTISFRSTGCVARPDGTLALTGTLSIHGRALPETFNVTVHPEGGRVVGDGELRFKQSEFGIKPYRGGPFGVVQNQDPIVLRVHLVAAP